MPPYKKEEFDVRGKEVTIQQVRGPDSSMGASEPSAWIDGGAAYALDSIEALPFDVSHRTPYDKVKSVVSFMVAKDLRFCPKCDSFRDADGFVSTGFAGRKCGTCANSDSTCGDSGKHDYTCVNPGQKRNAHVATKYRCTDCGHTKQSTPTG